MSVSRWRLGTGFKFKPKEGKLIVSPVKTAGLFVSPTYSIISNLPHMVIQFWQGGTTIKGFAEVAGGLLLSCSFLRFPCIPQFDPIYLQFPLPLLSILFSHVPSPCPLFEVHPVVLSLLFCLFYTLLSQFKYMTNV